MLSIRRAARYRKRVTGSPTEKRRSASDKVVPFLVEDELMRLGATLKKLPMGAISIIDATD